MIDFVSTMWENFTEALDTIKSVILGFVDIITSIFGLIPEPFSTILNVAVIIIIALVIAKVVRGWIMYDIIKNILDLCANFINKIFLFQVEFNGESVAIGKVVLAFLFVALTIYFIFDALGINSEE